MWARGRGDTLGSRSLGLMTRSGGLKTTAGLKTRTPGLKVSDSALVFFGVVSGVKIWPDECYVFRAVLGSLVAVMRVAGGPGGK